MLPGTAWGMAYGALAAAVVALALGVPWTIDLRAPYLASLLYLAVFGSVVAFGAYLTLLKQVGAGSGLVRRRCDAHRRDAAVDAVRRLPLDAARRVRRGARRRRQLARARAVASTAKSVGQESRVRDQ